MSAWLDRIGVQAAADQFRVSSHAQQEMFEENMTLSEVLEAIATSAILEDYPAHRRGACCLLNGLDGHWTPAARRLHHNSPNPLDHYRL
jgi:hypothetical protein